MARRERRGGGEMTLPEIVPYSDNGKKVSFITDTLLKCCIGRDGAHTWESLYNHFWKSFPGLDKKEIRDICHDNLLLGWCKDGVYVVNSIEEIEQAIKSRGSTVDSHKAYIARLDQERQFLLRKREEEERRKREGQSPQMRLF